MGRKEKIIVGVATLLLLLGGLLTPLFDVSTNQTISKEQSIQIPLQDKNSRQHAIGDPSGDPEVQNINTSESFTSIQDAIDDSNTVAGNILEVNSSTYTENVIITKAVTIRGIGTGEHQPLLKAASGIGFTVTVDNVTIENINISGLSIGIYTNQSGLQAKNNTFWFDRKGIDFNYTAQINTNTNYQIYDNTIEKNRFFINTTNDFDGAVIFDLTLNYQNHSGAITIGDFKICENQFLLNDSHAYAVLYNENLISWLEDGSISIGVVNISSNTLYKDNSENNAILFTGYLRDLRDVSVTVDDIIISHNTVKDQVIAAFYLEQYKVENWSGTTTGVFGDILVQDNVISSSMNSDGIQINENGWKYLHDDASLTIGQCTVERNQITVIDGYAIVFYMDEIGTNLENNAQVVVGPVNISANILSAGSGFLIDFYECGYRMYDDSYCSLNGFQITSNVIDCTEYGLHIQQFSYLGCDLHDNTSFIMGEIQLNNNEIESGSHGIFFSQLLVGETLSESAICSQGDLTIRNNEISSGGKGIVFIDNITSFELGNSMSENAVVSFDGIEISFNNISNADSGISIGPSLFGGENHQLTVDSFLILNNSISTCSLGLEFTTFSISDWCQPVIANNTIENCGVGIWFNSSYGNLVYNNYFDNTLNARDDTENTWNVVKTIGHNIIGGSYLGGNFWSDYTGIDGDDDTLGDTLLPYTSTGSISNGGDYHPLTLVSGNITLTPPTEFTARTVGSTQITLSWNKGVHAMNTRVMQKTGGYPSSITDGVLLYNGTGVTCSNVSLSSGVRYYFRAWSWNATTMLWSTTNASTTNITWIVPLVPGSFKAMTVDTDKINLTWTKSTYATHTRIQRDTGGYPIDINDGTPVYNGTSTFRLDSGLSEGVTYYYRAWSWNSTSRLWSSTNSSVSNTTWYTPLAPTNVHASTVGITRIDLSWTKGIHAMDTRVMQKVGGYPTSISDGMVLYNGTGVTCSNASLSPGVQYYFRVWSWNGTSSMWSPTSVSVSNTTWNVPLAPTGFTATTIGSNQINLTWNKGPYADYTRIQQKTTGYPVSISDGTLMYNNTGSSYPHTGLNVNTTYYYRAWSWNTTSKTWSTTNASVWNSTWTGPLAPPSITTVTRSTTRIDLQWTKGFRATHTRVMQKTSGYPVSISDGSLVYNGTGASCSNLSLTPGVRYFFKAWSWNSSSGLWSMTNATGSNMTWITPLAPNGFSATTIDTNKIRLIWTKGSYATHTRIQQDIDGFPVGITDGTNVYNGTSTMMTNIDLTENTHYYYRAWSWNSTSGLWSTTNASAGNTTWSTPDAPTGFVATTVTINHINLTWTKGAHAVFTRVMQKTSGYPMNISDGSVVYNGTGVAWSSSNLTIGTRYYFRAWSWNNTTGIWSLTNNSAINITGPFAPTSFTATSISTSQITLAWNKGNYANTTVIQRKTGGYPESISDGTTVYNGTNSSYNNTGLNSGTKYYYRAWSWNSSLEIWSVNYIDVQATTKGGGVPAPPPSSGNEAPTADAGGPYLGSVNQTIVLNGAGSSDDVQVVGYRWDWTNDGKWDTDWLTSSTTTHIYTDEGKYIVNLQVQDSEGLRDNDTTSVTITRGNTGHQAPVADAGGPYHGLTYQNIQFDGSKSYAMNASIVNYTWVFGDGSYGYDVSPIHSYDSAGTFTIILTIKDTNDLQSIDTTMITILLDANRNNISDIIDHVIGADITQADLHSVSIKGVWYYLVDTNHDGVYDVFFNPLTNKKTMLGEHDEKQLIDIDGDGHYDYMYDPILGLITPYEEVTTPLDSPWFSVALSVIIFMVILLVVWLYKTGRI